MSVAIPRPARFIVTGERGSGKTTFCRAVVAAVRALPAGPEVAGISSPARYEGGAPVGIDAEDLHTGARRRLARRRFTGEPSRPGIIETIEWRFEPEALGWGNAVLEAATPCGLLVVDELGPLEFERGEGWIAGLAAVDGGHFAAALVVVRPRLLPIARGRWPDGGVIEVGGPGDIVEAAGSLAVHLFAPPDIN